MFWRFTVISNFKMSIIKRKLYYKSPLVGNVIFPRIYYSNAEKMEIKTVKDEKIEKVAEKVNSKIIVQSIVDIQKNFLEKQLSINTETVNPKKKSMKVLKYMFLFLGISITAIGGYLMFEFGFPKNLQADKPTWRQYFGNIWNHIETFTLFIQEPSRDKLLPDPVPYPYYQPPYTLVLEFTDVLAHPDWTYKTGWRFKKRPGLDYMLENLVGLYEIVVFTAEPGITIFPVIDAIDQKHLISYKLVRDSKHFVDGHHVKNLDRLNRDLTKVVVVDWNAESVKFHPDNHFNLPRWKGDDDDTGLIDLTAFLRTIAHTEIEDVREVLQFYKQFENPLMEFRNKQKEYFESQEKIPPERPTQSIKKVFDYIM